MANVHRKYSNYCAIAIVAIMAVTFFRETTKALPQAKLQEEEESTLSIELEKPLLDFALQGSVPNTGVNTFLTSTVFTMLLGALDSESLADEIGLTKDQREQANDILDFDFQTEDVLAIEDETRTDPDLYDFLTVAQRRKLELAALRVEGCVALKRAFFVEELELDDPTIKEIERVIFEIRRDRVRPRTQRTFALPHSKWQDWAGTTDAIHTNLKILGLMSADQKAALVELVGESRTHERIYGMFLDELFQDSPQPKKQN